MHLCTPPPPKSTLFPYTTLFRSISNPTQPRARNPVDIPFNCITTLRCCVTVLKRSGITVELTRRRESKHPRSEEHTSELQSSVHIVCRLLLEKKKEFNVTYVLTP